MTFLRTHLNACILRCASTYTRHAVQPSETQTQRDLEGIAARAQRRKILSHRGKLELKYYIKDVERSRILAASPPNDAGSPVARGAQAVVARTLRPKKQRFNGVLGRPPPPRPPKVLFHGRFRRRKMKHIKKIAYQRWDVHGGFLGFRWLNPKLQRFPYLRTTPEHIKKFQHRRAVLYRRWKLQQQRRREAKERLAMPPKPVAHPTKLDKKLTKKMKNLGLEARERDMPFVYLLLLEQLGGQQAPTEMLDGCTRVLAQQPELLKHFIESARKRRFESLRTEVESLDPSGLLKTWNRER
ncbi:hypothetical protein BKA62DRAFT_704076 [Auriculariales sp. MPI-PUGE-AT-0066]|nr:hypothetical protein BKA62DRAFT_704076 [Auriculariales sp. MPI-PUGE-AT-0066]